MSHRLIRSPFQVLLVAIVSPMPLAAWGLVAGHHSLLGWIDLVLATILVCFVFTETLPDDPRHRAIILRRSVLAATAMASFVIVTALPDIEWDRVCWAWAAGWAGAYAPMRLTRLVRH